MSQLGTVLRKACIIDLAFPCFPKQISTVSFGTRVTATCRRGRGVSDPEHSCPARCSHRSPPARQRKAFFFFGRGLT
eukprot:4035224-Pyramimonas_sp.AAC.2